MNLESQSFEESTGADFDSLHVRELEMILANLLIAKYPGIEQMDLDCFFRALGDLNLERVEQIETDMAEKSAQWMLAVSELGR